MKLYKAVEKPKPEFNKHYLIPSIITMGIVPLLMHTHNYRTHIEDNEWSVSSFYAYQDIFLFVKQWAVIIIAITCLILLLARAKYYYEDLPFEKRAFIPAIIYMVLVFLSACFARQPIFAFAGGYEMFQSAICVLSYLVIMYYTYTCIQSEEGLLYFLRGSEYFILIELVIMFSQVIGHDILDTHPIKALIVNPSSWGNLDTALVMAKMVYGTLYNVDYLSMYLPLLVPIFLGLIIIEKKAVRKIFNCVLLALTLLALFKSCSSSYVAFAAALILAVIVFSLRSKKAFLLSVIVVVAAILGVTAVIMNVPALKTKVSSEVNVPDIMDDSDIPIKSITTGTKDKGVTIELKDGTKFRFTFAIRDQLIDDLRAYDGDGNELGLNLADANTQTYTFDDPKYAAENMYFYRDDAHGPKQLAFVKDGGVFYFTDSKTIVIHLGVNGSTNNSTQDEDNRVYLVSTAGREVTMPQKKYEVAEIFHNGFLSGRGLIYNRTIPLLKHFMILGAGDDNYIMVYPQRDSIFDAYIYKNGVNNINVKPHCFYLQVWVEEGFLALAALMVFFFWYLIRCIKLYKSFDIHDPLSVMGFMTMVGVVSYLVASLANDSNPNTAPVFWTLLGMGWGINRLLTKRQADGEQ